MTYLPRLNRVVQQGRGIASSILGETYSLYRLNGNTTGAVISSGSLVNPSFQMYFKKAMKTHIENETFDLQVFEATCDGTKLKVGDILVQNGYESDGGTYCVAQLRPMKPNMLIRVESQSAIQEPQPDAGSDETQPTTGVVWRTGYGGPTVGARYNLTLDNGMYQMLPFGEGTLASVSVGFQPLNKVRDSKKDGIPTSYARTLYLAYIPPTPGYQPAELDIIKSQSQESYSIQQVYSSDGVGITGTIAIVERMST